MAASRATTLTIDGRDFWVAAERLELVRRVYPDAAIDPPIEPPRRSRAHARIARSAAPPRSCAAGSNAPVR